MTPGVFLLATFEPANSCFRDCFGQRCHFQLGIACRFRLGDFDRHLGAFLLGQQVRLVEMGENVPFDDLDAFLSCIGLKRLQHSRDLGWHLHLLECRDQAVFEDDVVGLAGRAPVWADAAAMPKAASSPPAMRIEFFMGVPVIVVVRSANVLSRQRKGSVRFSSASLAGGSEAFVRGANDDSALEKQKVGLTYSHASWNQ